MSVTRPEDVVPLTAPLTPVVFTMGKVASSSVSLAIQAAGLTCYDIHSLEPNYLRSVARSWLDQGEYPPPHICVSMAFRDRLLVKRTRCLYITLVRDPLARNLSAFFQNLGQQPENIRNSQDTRKLFDRFREAYPHEIPLSWLKREFCDQLGIDVYRHRFGHAHRFTWVPRQNTLILRVDCPDAVKSNILSRLLGRPVTVKRDNDSGNKHYHHAYARVKELAIFDADFVADTYTSQFACHFWTPEERLKMAQRWISPEEVDRLADRLATASAT